MRRFSIIRTLLFYIIFVVCMSFPVENYVDDIDKIYIIKIAFRVLLLALMIVQYAYRFRKDKPRVKKLLFFIPCLLGCLGAPAFLLYCGDMALVAIDYTFYYELAMCLATVGIEEIIFRLSFHSIIPIRNKMKKVLIMALIFTVFECGIYVFFIDISYLLRAVIFYALGFILGYMVEFGGSIYPCFIFRFIYEACNTVLLKYTLVTTDVNTDFYYYFSFIILAIVCGYLVILYFKKYKHIYD